MHGVVTILVCIVLAICGADGHRAVPGGHNLNENNIALTSSDTDVAVQQSTPSTSYENDTCAYSIVESIPYGLNTTLPNADGSTADAWLDLINGANESLHIACFYLTLNVTDGSTAPPPPGYGHEVGLSVYEAIVAAYKRGIDVKIVQSLPQNGTVYPDSDRLIAMGIDLKYVDFGKLTGGILHTKFIVADERAFYVGSANMDWRSLTQVKEAGVHVTECSELAVDLDKLFDVYWLLTDMSAVPTTWPDYVETKYNETSPALLSFGGQPALVFIASSPPPIVPPSRTGDIDALLAVIANAEFSVCVEVMDYLPLTQFMPVNYYWPVIDDALREAAFNNNVTVHLLISLWNYSDPSMFSYLVGLDELTNIEVRLMEIPVDGPFYVPYTRVNHAKFMVTDNQAYITTSNWCGCWSLRLNVGGVAVIARVGPLR
eukprot:TRINITY_DN4921_c0_g4_i1.p1 TRINITY_DN4921_c0_g4~~TRINITY_DN4921_c0_g4_i1.p1  ORF type:complete len:443 (+),score=96.71 TRINITY_DN4921_c0_g4_i1:38-1330(+)